MISGLHFDVLRPRELTMKKNLFMGLAILSGIVAVVAPGPMTEGVAKGLAGTFIALFFVFLLLGNQPTDDKSH